MKLKKGWAYIAITTPIDSIDGIMISTKDDFVNCLLKQVELLELASIKVKPIKQPSTYAFHDGLIHFNTIADKDYNVKILATKRIQL